MNKKLLIEVHFDSETIDYFRFLFGKLRKFTECNVKNIFIQIYLLIKLTGQIYKLEHVLNFSILN